MDNTISGSINKFAIIYIHEYRFTKVDWHSILHTHYFTEIMYITDGEGTLELEKRSIPVKIGDVILVNPYVLHTEKSSEAHPLSYVVFGLDNIQFSQKEVSGNNAFVFADQSHEMLPLVKILTKESTDQAAGYELILHQLTSAFIIMLIRVFDFSVKDASDKSISKNGSLIKDFLDRHYKEALTLEYISDQLHLDKYYIIHTFKQNFATTPMNYVMHQRIRKSKELLASTDYSIGQISQITGFESQSYFNQLFRKIENTSPKAYRTQAKAVFSSTKEAEF